MWGLPVTGSGSSPCFNTVQINGIAHVRILWWGEAEEWAYVSV